MAQQSPDRARFPPGDPWRYRWIVLGVATFTQASSGFFVGGIGALSVHFQRALDLSAAQLGLLVSAAQFVPLAGLLVAGELLDRYSERWVVGIGAGVVALALGMGSLAPGYPALLVALLVVGAGYSSVQPGGSKSVASWFDASQRGFAMGIRQAGLPLGAAVASAVLPLVAEEFGWRATLLTGGLVALSGAFLFLGCYQQPPVLPAPRHKGSSNPLTARLRARLRMLREPSMVKIMLSGTSLISVQYGVAVLTVLHLHQTSSVGAGQAALVLVASQGAGVAGRICLAAWSDHSRSGRYAIVLVCMIAVVAGLTVLLTPAGRAPLIASGAFVWLGFFGFGWYGPWVAYVTEAAPPGKTGFALGVAMSVNQIAIVTMPPALGLLADLTGSFTPVWALLALLTVVALTVTAAAEHRTQ
ncbi:MFS transporter [Streptomyces sp. NBC_00690]|uniref:MFS transporter n=1 Tax=Streptomyces sp. NBC_00690 TaxID=2975808 RepID=UPI002E2C7AC6|nr:MFS transporter [Streptomyces sp. NBC_00690]